MTHGRLPAGRLSDVRRCGANGLQQRPCKKGLAIVSGRELGDVFDAIGQRNRNGGWAERVDEPDGCLKARVTMIEEKS